MSLISETGTYRGRVTGHEIGQSSGGWSQWVASLLAVQVYNAEDGEWIPLPDDPDFEITAWMILFGKKGATRNVAQLEKAVGWDGISIIELGEMDLSEVTIQFRVEENTYQGKTSLRVNWIDASDATPGRSVQKLDPSELNKLQAAYARVSGKKKAVKPAKAKTPPKAPSKAALPAPGPQDGGPLGKCTKKEAWDDVCKATEAGRTDDSITAKALDDAWLAAIQKYSQTDDPDSLTNEGWYQVKVAVKDVLLELPF